MIVRTAASVEAALAEGLARVEGRARVVRGCPIEIALPRGLVEAVGGETVDAIVATVDAASIDAAAAALEGDGAARVVWIVAVTGIGARGAIAWMLSRTRRLRPVALEDACDALRRAGVIDVRVVAIEGALGLVVLHGHRAPTR